MAPSIRQKDVAPRGAPQNQLPDDRRESVRIDDRVLLEYWPAAKAVDGADHPRRFGQIPLSGSPDTAEAPPLHALVIQWMSKVEWTLDAILQTIEKQSPNRLSAPQLMDVNVCGDAIRFLPSRPLHIGDLVDLRMVLPPFVVVEARGEVFQVRPDSSGPDPAHTVVLRFVDISEADREKIVRYVIQRQADLQRRRQRSPQP